MSLAETHAPKSPRSCCVDKFDPIDKNNIKEKNRGRFLHFFFFFFKL